MRIGDLVKHKEYEQYGIVEDVLCFHELGKYVVVFWQCGNKSGLYESGLEVINANR